MKIRVFLIDDHSVVRQGLRMLIDAQSDMEVIGEYDRGHGAGNAVERAAPDVVVMDVSMPDRGGAAAAEDVRRSAPRTKILVLTRHSEKAHLKQMVSAGATGYVLKQTPAELLIHGIRAVAGGRVFIDPAIVSKLDEGVRSVIRDGTPPLTPREQEIVTMVAFGHTNKEIATTLGIAIKTVETHKANIMQKLGIGSRAELVRFAISQGWLTR